MNKCLWTRGMARTPLKFSDIASESENWHSHFENLCDVTYECCVHVGPVVQRSPSEVCIWKKKEYMCVPLKRYM